MIMMSIGGEPYRNKLGKVKDVINPMTRKKIGEVAMAEPYDVDMAFRVAKERQSLWQDLAADTKEQIFYKAAAKIKEQKEELADIIVEESGSTKQKALGEVAYSSCLLQAAAGEIRRLYGDTLPDDKPERFSLVIREPLGVVAVISPFNAPMALFVKMLAFPLAAGNTIVAKPSEETPGIASKLAEIFTESGLPPGVFNVVHGLGRDVGAQVVRHPILDGLTFTGSTPTGKQIGAILGSNLKALHLELGGNNPLIIMDDCDIEKAAETTLFGSFFHAGQVCMASSRVLIDEKIYQDFIDALLPKVLDLSFGDLRDKSTYYGPLINEMAVQSTLRRVNRCVKQGAKVLTGGQLLDGWRYAPTILEGVHRDMDLWQKETFAPVIAVKPFKDAKEALDMANDTAYGLSAGILCKNFEKSVPIAKKLRCGGVHIGSHPFQSGSMTPVGGRGLSGIGKSGGKYSTHHFTQLKWVSLHINNAI